MRKTPKVSGSSTSNTFPEMSNIPTIFVPFPPKITAEDYLKKKRDGSFPNKSMNCFMLYRIAFNKELRAKGICVRQQSISRHISDSWQNEPDYVRKVYRDLAVRAQEELDQMRKCSLGPDPLFTFATDDRIRHSDFAQSFNASNIQFNNYLIGDNFPMLHSVESAALDSIQIPFINNNIHEQNSSEDDHFKNYSINFLPTPPESSLDGTLMDLNYFPIFKTNPNSCIVPFNYFLNYN
ncbi:4946_t:CDS:1 [Ambispora gerdemannii]|uniref:4946_t:CDS:1 n=1 Tax=Ambispora gerdemannii TaxID=144530 RepID=A0A9N9FVA9_9GLOM|nr:4946_t:CDS:1 [Ambispora gerdemannii]